MTEEEFSKNLSLNINEALYKTLNKHFPAPTVSKHLIDIVNVLMEGLAKGEVQVDFRNKPNGVEIKADGWPEEHIKALLSSGWTSGESAPITIKGNKISWKRWSNQLEIMLKNLTERANKEIKREGRTYEKELFDLQATLNKEQISAVNSITDKNLILLSGGPGTGKTSTIAHMILQAISSQDNLKIGLAAPTGKAAKKLRNSLIKISPGLQPPLNEILLDIPCKTIHKWLLASPQRFGKNKRNQLYLDLLVIDEMSMVDMTLMQGVLEALPKSSQLILIGDPNQLPPIGSGDIWNQLQGNECQKDFKEYSVKLKKTYRNRGEIASLSKVINTKGVDTFFKEILKASPPTNINAILANSQGIPSVVISRLESHKGKLKSIAKRLSLLRSQKSNEKEFTAKEIDDLINQLNQCLENLIILCPRKGGKWGVNNVHRALLGNDFKERFKEWEEGTPVMCQKNQPELGLANGDIGIIIGKGPDRSVFFNLYGEDQTSQSCFFHPARIKEIEPAFAMTIHKAQGSESDHVILLWPEAKDISPSSKVTKGEDLYEKRLIYTGITRAKEKLDILINKF